MVRDTKVEHMAARTGHGLLSYNATDFPMVFMGLEGHKRGQSHQALKNLKYNHTTKEQTHAHHYWKNGHKFDWQYHDAEFSHYGWEVTTLAPLLLEVFKSVNYTHAWFYQRLPPLINEISVSASLKPPCYCQVSDNQIGIYYPLDISGGSLQVSSLETMEDIYAKIWKICDSIYYLNCETLEKRDQPLFAMVRQFDDKPRALDTIY